MHRNSHLAFTASLSLVIVGLYGCNSGTTNQPAASKLVPEPSRSFREIDDSLFALPLNKANSSDSAETRFAVLEDCGVDFKNFMKRSITNMLLETGSGVALGDYDNDGLIDIYFTGSDVENKLYRNLGNLKFEDVTETAGVDGRMNDVRLWASGASFADVDNDGDLDLFVCNMAAPDLLYINQGNGTFKEEGFSRNIAYNGASKQANFCDFDQDGDLDIYLVTYQDIVEIDHEIFEEVDGVTKLIPGKEEYGAIIDGHLEYWAGEQDLLYLNDGSGNFENVATDAGISGYDCGLASVWLDYDNDGWQDIYVTSDFKQPDHLYRNNHDGTFTDILPSTVRRTPWYSMGVDAGDINNDGMLDFLVADMADTSHYGQKINMGDMSDSGWFLTYGEPRQFMVNCLFMNTGMRQFFEVARIVGVAKSNWTWSVRFADLDLDGNQDLFFTNGHARDNMNSDLVLKLKELKKKKGGKNLTFLERNEFGIQIPVRNETNMAFANRGNLDFEPVAADWGLDFHGVSHAAGFADLDLDGDLDCVVNNYYSPSLVYENRTQSSGRLLVELRSAEENHFGVGSKVEIWQNEKYQRRDLLPGRGYLTSDPMMVHFGVMEEQNIDRLKVTWPDGRIQEFHDLSVNHLYRIIDNASKTTESMSESDKLFVNASKSAAPEFTHTESDYDDFAIESLLPFQLSRLGGSVSCADVNNDNIVDLFAGGAAGQSGELFLGNGKGFEKVPDGPWQKHTQREDMGSLFFDADGDGDLDLYVCSGSNEHPLGSKAYRDRLYRNDGNGKFVDVTQGSLPDLHDSSICVCAADFDRDGDLDLFVGSRSVPGQYPVAPQSRLLTNENGKFSAANFGDVHSEDDLAANVGLVNSAIWSDYNDDGWPDLIIASEWQPIQIFKNSEGTFSEVTQELGLGTQLGWWHGIAAADLDADGDMDFVVTNQGHNTKYHASVKHPHRIYFEDFDNNGRLDIVESEYEGDIEYPVRGRSCSSRCMPFIADKFPTFHDFSLATLDDIYDTSSKKYRHVELNYLDSVVIWNEGDKFEMMPLPKLAQISPAYGVSVADFDGDGRQDIALATNFFSSQPETGYMDGGLGLLLKGTAERKFEPQWPKKSGIVVTGDANGLVAADFDNDGDKDLLFAMNNDSMKLLENQSSCEMCQISITGPPSNLEAIGSVIKLHIGENVQAFQVSAGGSYLSQSPNKLAIAKELFKSITKVTVRWPDGKRAEFSMDKDENELKIKY